MLKRTSLFIIAACCLVLLYAADDGHAQDRATVEIKRGETVIEIEPATLRATMKKQGQTLPLSAATLEADEVADLKTQAHKATWRLVKNKLRVMCEIDDEAVTFRFIAEDAGELAWPVMHSEEPFRAWIIPRSEGVYIPAVDRDWIDHLANEESLNTNEFLSMPFIARQTHAGTLTLLLDNPFNNEIRFTNHNDRLAATITHAYTPNQKTKQTAYRFVLGDVSPVTPARVYRKDLLDSKQFVSMREKIAATPRAERLLGAPHVYIWGEALFTRHDVKPQQWKALSQRLIDAADNDANSKKENDLTASRLWNALDDEGKAAAKEIITLEWPHKFVQSQLTDAINRVLLDGDLTPDQKIAAQEKTAVKDERIDLNRALFAAAFNAELKPMSSWGGGMSTAMIDAFAAAGLDRLNITTSDLFSAQHHAHVAEHAEARGYLFGPYDSYHSIHSPDAKGDDTWDTAQFDAELYATGAITRRDGSERKGFKQRGYLLSPLVARPYFEKRISSIKQRVPFSAWFIDCDAFGQVFDDYSKTHPATQRDDMNARIARLRWISAAQKMVVGSEGGVWYAAPVIHFAHGMLTPVFGWGDPDLKDRESQYDLGGWWPPDGPAVFTKQVPLKPVYEKLYYDPRFRLPLYQMVYHDSVIATHHWGYHSLKFTDQVETVALTEQLYNVPPLHHMNPDEFIKHKAHMTKHDAFFSPLHRRLALTPMTDFSFLTGDRLVQQTTYGDVASITANFRTKDYMDGDTRIPARTVIARWGDSNKTLTYQPAKQNDKNSEATDKPNSPAKQSDTLSPDAVLRIAQQYTNGGGFNRKWAGSGTVNEITYGGQRILSKGKGGTYCCGYTFDVVMNAAEQYDLLDGCTFDKVKRFQKEWYGAIKGKPETLCVDAVQMLDIGHAVSHEDAMAGDFAQLWRTNGSGHSVVFLEWVERDGQRIGLKYRSSQGATKGIGDHTEYFADSGIEGGKVDRSRVYLCRLNKK